MNFSLKQWETGDTERKRAKISHFYRSCMQQRCLQRTNFSTAARCHKCKNLRSQVGKTGQHSYWSVRYSVGAHGKFHVSYSQRRIATVMIGKLHPLLTASVFDVA
eukprot:GILJ01043221.1.p2 GENE.GILJ01043221.1~~GILJ01043221.1.p2  ORF type:complete len:105 (+),score=5.83 GILJ01043221.1:62-376(+)